MSIVDSTFTDQNYTFEVDDEGWTYDSEASREVFGEESWEVQDSTQIQLDFTFELETSLQYEVVQSINAYSTATLEMSDRDSNYIHRNRSYNERRALKDLTIERESGENILKGEIN